MGKHISAVHATMVQIFFFPSTPTIPFGLLFECTNDFFCAVSFIHKLSGGI